MLNLPRTAIVRIALILFLIATVPAFVKKRVVAIIEIVDPKESAATAVEPAAEYAALQLARFLERRKKKR